MTDALIAWEFQDGSGSYANVPQSEVGTAVASLAAAGARVWVDDELVERGWIASDEYGW